MALQITHEGPTSYATLSWRRDIDAEQLCEDDADLAVHQAQRLNMAAFRELENAVLRRVSKLVKEVYPTATALKYDGEENEDGLLHTYVREILDADGEVLDSQDDPSDHWEELIDEDVEPLLWEVSERDQSYYGEDKTLELGAEFGHCDTCGAPCDANGCTIDRAHKAALDVDDPAPRI